MNARLRIIRPNSLEPNNNVQIILTDEEKHKVTCTLPISMFAYAVMGVSGIDCEMEIVNMKEDR